MVGQYVRLSRVSVLCGTIDISHTTCMCIIIERKKRFRCDLEHELLQANSAICRRESRYQVLCGNTWT